MLSLVDLARQRAALEPGISDAVAQVLAHGAYVNGPEVAALETALSDYLGGVPVVGCASGSDALILLLRAAGIGPGDAVVVPSLTFVATAQSVAAVGATPVFADVCDDGTLDPDSTAAALDMLAAQANGPVARAVIAVDLFALPADHTALSALCAARGLRLFYDAAHSVGTLTPHGPCGTYGDGAATSFYPSKALGCYGDGGAVMARDPDFAARVRQIANHGVIPGQGHALIGANSRLDTVQAAILLRKLAVFAAETDRRRAIAARYATELGPLASTPQPGPGTAPVWSYYCITHPDRDGLKAHLADQGIGAVAYYATPTHRHPAYTGFPTAPGGLPVTERFAARLLCLPMHAYLTEAEVTHITQAVAAYRPAA